MHTSSAQVRSRSLITGDIPSSGKRIPALDLVKWLAIVSMVVDHSRAIWPSLQLLTLPGRLAFPLFCLVMASNVVRQSRGAFNTPGNIRYFASLMFFGVISQPIFFEVFQQGLNIFWLLTIALTLTFAVHHRTPVALLLGALGLLVACLLHKQLGYHVVGILIPASMAIALESKGVARGAWIIVSCVLCCLANILVPEVLASLLSGEKGTMIVAAAAFSAPLVGFWLVGTKMTLSIKPIGRWGYLFYPLHLGILMVVRNFGHS